MPEACVLIAVHDGAPWIGEALDSALAQRDVDLEILVVDDGSKDATPAILAARAAAHPGRIRVLTIEHSGRSHARNFGADHVATEFVTFLDADDRMHPLRVRLECDALRAHPDAVLSFSGRWNFDDGSEVGTLSFTPAAFRARPGRFFTLLADPISSVLAAGEFPGTNACTCRTGWVRERGRLDPRFAAFEDGERWIRCLHDTPAVYVAAPLYQRRLHPAATFPARSIAELERGLFAMMDSARSRWSRYSPEQRVRLVRFERSTGVWLARRAAELGRPRDGIALLLRHAGRLRSAAWLGGMAYLLTPRFVRGALRRLRRRPAPPVTVPLAEVAAADPTRTWREYGPAQDRSGRAATRK